MVKVIYACKKILQIQLYSIEYFSYKCISMLSIVLDGKMLLFYRIVYSVIRDFIFISTATDCDTFCFLLSGFGNCNFLSLLK